MPTYKSNHSILHNLSLWCSELRIIIFFIKKVFIVYIMCWFLLPDCIRIQYNTKVYLDVTSTFGWSFCFGRLIWLPLTFPTKVSPSRSCTPQSAPAAKLHPQHHAMDILTCVFQSIFLVFYYIFNSLLFVGWC